MSVKFEGYERRIAKIEKALKEFGIESLEAARDLCLSKGVDVESIVRGVQPIAFENAVWAYTLGAAIAINAGAKSAKHVHITGPARCQLVTLRYVIKNVRFAFEGLRPVAMLGMKVRNR